MERTDGRLNIPEIIRACAKAGVKNFKYGDLEITFPETHEEKVRVERKAFEASFPRLERPRMAAPWNPHDVDESDINKPDDDLIEQDEEEHLLLSDPLAYEDLVSKDREEKEVPTDETA